MGSGVLVLDGVGEVTYFSNTGTTGWYVCAGGHRRSIMRSASTQMGYRHRHDLRQGVAVGDYNCDGATTSCSHKEPYGTPASTPIQPTSMRCFCRQKAVFCGARADRGLAPFTHADSRTEAAIYSSRALLKADLDHDGTLEFLTAGRGRCGCIERS